MVAKKYLTFQLSKSSAWNDVIDVTHSLGGTKCSGQDTSLVHDSQGPGSRGVMNSEVC